MSANPPGASKRKKSSSHSALEWADYDVDLLDNVHRTKRFAVDVSFSADLASKMSMGGPTGSGMQSPSKSVTRQTLTAVGDPMCVSSAEGSPAVTPVIACCAGETGPGAPPPTGWSTPQRSVALGTVAGLSLTSPSDPVPGGQDLRKMTLRRVALGISRSRGAAAMMAATGSPAPAEESGSPMALSGGGERWAAGVAATPAVGRPRSRLAQRGGAGQEGLSSATGAGPRDAKRTHDL
jgi:hypothetical protein